MRRRVRRVAFLQMPFRIAVVTAVFPLAPLEGALGSFSSSDTVDLPDSVAFPLAEAFLNERRDNCALLPGAIRARGCDSGCRHPLDDYISLRNDSIAIRSGGKTALAAYEAFRRVDRSGRSYSFVHKEFLAFIHHPEPPVESWISRRILRPLISTFAQLLRLIAPRLGEAWNLLSSPGRVAVIAVIALFMLVFCNYAARTLTRTTLIRRKLSKGVFSPAEIPVKTDWLAKTDANLGRGHYREALTCLYAWFVTWTVECGMVRRHEWWTNRQLIAALGRSRPAVQDLARSLIAAYEATEYGHRPAEAATVDGLRNRARLELEGGRP